MKPWMAVFGAAALLTNGCATDVPPPTPTQRLQVRVDITGPKVDLKHLPRPITNGMPVEVYPAKSPFINQMVKVGIGTAVECNPSVTQCKHAVVLPEANFIVEQLGNNTAILRGTFDVAIGRSLTNVSETAGSRMTETRTIADDVSVIEEGKFSYPFSTTLRLGQPYSVDGRLDTRVTFTLHVVPTFNQIQRR